MLEIARYGFNPTLVRLRPPIAPHDLLRFERFQSHAGSIEAHARRAALALGLRFQSHAGSIEAWRATSSSRSSPSFNPTLVRLRRGALLRGEG